MLPFSLCLLLLTSVVPSSLVTKAQTRPAKSRPRRVKVVPRRSAGKSLPTSGGRVDAKEIESCMAGPEEERPEASLCFSAVDLICPDCKRGKEVSVPQPTYPEVARAAKVSGQVGVKVVIDESGRVVWARVVKGHPLLQLAALRAACRVTFEPYTCRARGVKAVEYILYDFKLP